MSAESLRPTEWHEYQGQERLKGQLDTYCSAAALDQRPLPHVLLAAEPGFGKTSLAALIAAQLQDPFFVLTMPMKPAALMQFFNRFRGGVVLFDEFHRLSKSAQEDFLNPLEDGYFTTPNGRKIVIPFFTAILATTEPQDIIAPVRRRIPIRNLTFEPYTEEELGRIVQQMAAKLDLGIEDDLALGLGRAAGGRPGEAESLVTAARALAKRGPLTLERILAFCDVDPDGITRDHRTVLAAIDKLAGLGAVGMARLADYCGMHESMVRSLEKLLLDRDLISFGPGGRELTSDGVARVRDDRGPAVGAYRVRGAA